MGDEFQRLFQEHKINKILTIEASGIGIAVMTARHFGDVPVVFAKNQKHQIFQMIYITQGLILIHTKKQMMLLFQNNI